MALVCNCYSNFVISQDRFERHNTHKGLVLLFTKTFSFGKKEKKKWICADTVVFVFVADSRAALHLHPSSKGIRGNKLTDKILCKTC